METGIKVRYKGMPIFQVGYVIERVSKELADFWINGSRVIERAAGYILVPANSMPEARAQGLAKVLAEPRAGMINLRAEPTNTHEWHGESNNAEAANRAYQRYKQNGLAL